MPAAPRTMLAAVPSWRQRSELLVRLDARTLERRPGPGLRIRLAPFATAWSPDHRLLAITGEHGPVGPDGADWPTAPQLRIVDAAHLRVLRTTRLLAGGGHAQWVAWLGPDHVLVLGWRGPGGWLALVVDVRTGRITRRLCPPAELGDRGRRRRAGSPRRGQPLHRHRAGDDAGLRPLRYCEA